MFLSEMISPQNGHLMYLQIRIQLFLTMQCFANLASSVFFFLFFSHYRLELRSFGIPPPHPPQGVAIVLTLV